MRGMGRRGFLAAIGVSGAVALAGCVGGPGSGGEGGDGGGNGDGEAATLPGEDYPAIDTWLTETDAGDADDTYDGSLVDRRDADSVTVDVGAAGNGGNFAYAPSALVVSTGTEIRWVWTGQGDPHNVEAEPDEQIGESDFEFSSGEPQSGEGTEYTRTFDESGVALYHCEPHLAVGMKGGIAVE